MGEIAESLIMHITLIYNADCFIQKEQKSDLNNITHIFKLI